MDGRRNNKKNKTSNVRREKEPSSHSVAENPATNNSELPQRPNERKSSSGVQQPMFSGSLRIADLDFLFRQFQALEQHADKGCGITHFKVTGRKTEGAKFGWEMECRKCGFKKIIYSEENINRNAQVVTAQKLISHLFSK